MAALGHSRPRKSAPILANVRCWSNSDHSTAEFACPLSANSGQNVAAVGLWTKCHKETYVRPDSLRLLVSKRRHRARQLGARGASPALECPLRLQSARRAVSILCYRLYRNSCRTAANFCRQCGRRRRRRDRIAIVNPIVYPARISPQENLNKSFISLAVPRVVPRPCDFNYLQCQTSLTALTGAKAIFLDCQTEILNARDLHSVRFTSESGHLHALADVGFVPIATNVRCRRPAAAPHRPGRR